MSKIKFASQAQNIVSEIFENYRLAYVGGNFSKAFLDWNNSLISSLENLTPTPVSISLPTPIGDVTYSSIYINGNVFHLVERIVFDTVVLSKVEASRGVFF